MAEKAAWSAAPEAHEAVEDEHEDAQDSGEKHTYEAHEVMKAAPAPEAMTQQFNEALNDITLELDKLDD